MGFITVFGGTFNPIHIGHSEILRALTVNPLVDKVILMPTKIPPHKVSDCLAVESDRFNMCKLIASDFDNVEVSDLEIYRQGKSYTIDTVNALCDSYPNKKIAITIGGDMLVSFHTWKEYKSILKKCSIFTFKRTDISNEDYTNAINNLKSLGGDIIEINTTITGISSTEIRNSLLINKTSKFLDYRVNDYIVNNNLYGV